MSKSQIIFYFVIAGFALTFVSTQEFTAFAGNPLPYVNDTNNPTGPQFNIIRPMEVTPADTNRTYDVIVIGAGVSGLEAAKHLQEKNLSVVVLEARDRIGGRVWTNNTNAGSFDLGGSWIHGLGNATSTPNSVVKYTRGGLVNPIYKMANYKIHVTSPPTNYMSAALYDSHGNNRTTEWNNFNTITSNFWGNYTHPSGNSMNYSIADFTAWAKNNGKNINSTMLDYYLYWWYLFDNSSDNASQLSSQLMINDTEEAYYYGLDEEDEVIFVNGGYDQIANHLANGTDIKHAVVNKIEYGNNGVSVFTDKGVFNASYAISTLPLGVLKSGSVIFDPPLTQTDPNKVHAINDLNMGDMDKAYFVFKTPSFWQSDIDKDWINRVPNNGSDWGWLTFFNLYKYTGKPVLLGFNSGQYARNLENKSDQEIINSGLSVLGSMYKTQIPQPVSYSITRWANDPFARGSYSSPGPNAIFGTIETPTDYDYLEEPINNKLFFAGEATERYYSATVHGAFLSGYRAAEKILDLNNEGTPPDKQLGEVGFTSIICNPGQRLMNQTMFDGGTPACVYNNDVQELQHRNFLLVQGTQ